MKTTTLTSEYISKTSKEYSIYVATNRAIPSVTDGLKDGQRKFLWLMRNKPDKIKTVSQHKYHYVNIIHRILNETGLQDNKYH